jgi:hypothetical protein
LIVTGNKDRVWQHRQNAAGRPAPGFTKARPTQISFAGLPETEEQALNAIPTRLKRPAEQMDRLIAAGRQPRPRMPA